MPKSSIESRTPSADRRSSATIVRGPSLTIVVSVISSSSIAGSRPNCVSRPRPGRELGVEQVARGQVHRHRAQPVVEEARGTAAAPRRSRSGERHDQAGLLSERDEGVGEDQPASGWCQRSSASTTRRAVVEAALGW